MSVYDFEADLLNGKPKKLSEYQGKALLVVNVASKCGLTPQYAGLESLYREYKDKGFEVLGFPCDQFANQEFDSSEEIEQFCSMNYGVSFPMFSKIDVNGSNTHPLFAYLKSQQKGALGSQSIKWNFTKFLVDQEGNVIKRYAPTEAPARLIPGANE